MTEQVPASSWAGCCSPARSTRCPYPCHRGTEPHLKTGRKSPWTAVLGVSKCGWPSYTTEQWGVALQCLQLSKQLAGHLLLAPPELAALKRPITQPPLLKHNSHFSFSPSKISIISPSQAQQCPPSLTNPQHKAVCTAACPVRGCCSMAARARAPSTARGTAAAPAEHGLALVQKGKGSGRALTFKNCGVTRRTVATRQICSSVADLKARAIADSKPLQEGVGTRHNQTIYLRRRGRRPFFSC